MTARLRPLLLPALCTLLAGALLVGLGVWQLHRLAWKEALLARIETRAKATPQPLPPSAAWGALKPEDYDYRHVALDGTFRHDKEALVFHGSEEGPGYLVLTPLDLKGGGTLIVNRGFVPENRKDKAARGANEPHGPVHLTGLMRPTESRNLFTPADEPGKDLFFTRDPRRIAADLGVGPVAPFSVDVDASRDKLALPRGGATQLVIPNNHLSYALTWFGLAFALAGVFAAFAWRRLAEDRDEAAEALQTIVPARR